MSLEQAISELNSNIVALIGALNNGAAPAVPPSRAEGDSPKAAGDAPPSTRAKGPKAPMTDEKRAELAVNGTDTTLEDVKKATIALVQAKGQDVAKKVLAKFGAQRAGDVPIDKFGDYVDACTQAAKAA